MDKVTIKSILQLKNLVQTGLTIYWKSTNYIVKKDKIGQYLIICQSNNACVGIESENDPQNFYYFA